MKNLLKSITLALALPAMALTASAQDEIYPELIINGSIITGTVNERYGDDLAIDGDLLAVAAPFHRVGGKRHGAVYVYQREGNPNAPTWVFKQQIVGPVPPHNFLDPSDVHPSFWGYAITLKDGLLVVGESNSGNNFPLEENLFGALHFFQWNAMAEEFSGSGTVTNFEDDGPRTQHKMGSAISVSNNLIVTGERSGTHVYVFRKDGPSTYTRLPKVLKPSGASSFGTPILFGTQSVCLDGDRLAVGAPRTSSNRGAVYTYTFNGTSFDYEGTVFTPDSSGTHYYGDSVRIKGETMAVAAAGNGVGAVYVYRRENGAWGSEQKLVHSASTGISNFRHGMAGLELSDDGLTLFATSNAGKFVSWRMAEDGSWVEGPAISRNGTAAFPGFGLSIGFGEGTLVGSVINNLDGVPYHVHTFEYDGSNDTFLADQLRSQLYHNDAVANPRWLEDKAAFRYRMHVYNEEEFEVDGETELRIVRTDAALTDHYGAEEEARVDSVLTQLEARLDQDPFGASYQQLFLDIIYDRAQIKMLQAQDALIGLDVARINPPQPGQKVIDNEIALYEASLPILREAIQTMVEALDADIAFTVGGEPAGFNFFQNLVPGRTLEPVTFLDEGTVRPLLDEDDNPITDTLVDGYRDALLFFQMLGEYGCSAAQLAQLYQLKGLETEAADLIGSARELVFLQGSMLRGIFRDPVTMEDPTLLTEALESWEQGIQDLKAAEDEFGNGLNPLGYDDDFLVLLQRADGDDESIFNTFNILAESIDNMSSNSNYLQRAENDRAAAETAYDNFRGGLDELKVGLISVNTDAMNRLVQLVGYEYGTTQYDQTPGPNTGVNGGFKQGSELWDQFQNIRRARVQIQKNGQEIQNLEEKVRIEVERNLFEVEQQNAISDIRIEYAGQRAEMEEELGRINAAQKYAEVLADSLNPANFAQVVGNAVNAGVQVYGELRKGEIAAERERLAAQESADITNVENEILNANSAALIATWMLDMKTLVLSSQENAIILQQEMGRLVGLMRERETLERRIESHTETLKERYFADPVHRLRFLNEMHSATSSFETAQQTVFLMARALEYKWNTPFDEFMGGTGTTMTSIFCARNAKELQDIVDDMRGADMTNISTIDYEDVFSLKEDAFGYTEGEMHPDPQTGLMVTATEAFRSRLEAEFLIGDPTDFALINIPFSTVRDPLQSFFGPDFFRGPRRVTINPDGTLSADQIGSSAGRYLDKIQEIAVTMPGNYGPGPVTAPCELIYSGTSFLRTRSLGRYNEVLDPGTGEFRYDRLSEEMTAVPVRSSTFLNGAWQTNNQLLASPSVGLPQVTWPNPPSPPTEASYVDTFRERSIACNGWEITITLKDGVTYAEIGEIDDILLHIRHEASPRGVGQ